MSAWSQPSGVFGRLVAMRERPGRDARLREWRSVMSSDSATLSRETMEDRKSALVGVPLGRRGERGGRGGEAGGDAGGDGSAEVLLLLVVVVVVVEAIEVEMIEAEVIELELVVAGTLAT